MSLIEEITERLLKILDSPTDEKLKYVKDIQNLIWECETFESKELEEILRTLAFDLDFYEPNSDWRIQDFSFYSDDKLHEEVKSALIAIKKYQTLR